MHYINLHFTYFTYLRLVLDLPTPEGWKAELTLVLVVYCRHTNSQPSK